VRPWPDVPRGVKRIVARGLARDRDRRHADLDAHMSEALRDVRLGAVDDLLDLRGQAFRRRCVAQQPPGERADPDVQVLIGGARIGTPPRAGWSAQVNEFAFRALSRRLPLLRWMPRLLLAPRWPRR